MDTSKLQERFSEIKDKVELKKRLFREMLLRTYIEEPGKVVQMVSTPRELCQEITRKLKENCDLCGKIILTMNIEFLEFLVGCGASEIWFYADNEAKKNFVMKWYKGCKKDVIKVISGDFLSEGFQKYLEDRAMKFSVIIGNPPYQPPVEDKGGGGSGSRNTLWDKFVELSLELVEKDGYLCLVHPAKWRKPLDELGKRMKAKQFHYLEIHNANDGIKTFGAGTRYDWYILQNTLATNSSIVKDELGEEHKIDLSKMDLIPNFDFELLEKVLAKPGCPKCEILFSYKNYETRQEWMNEKQDNTFKYPCVTATADKGVRLWYSSKKGEFFGIPKIIFSDAYQVSNAVVDMGGKYAMTQHAMAIPISSQQEGEQMKQALESEKFNTFLKACRWSNFQIDWRMFQFFRKDFWKEFT